VKIIRLCENWVGDTTNRTIRFNSQTLVMIMTCISKLIECWVDLLIVITIRMEMVLGIMIVGMIVMGPALVGCCGLR
jgi:hypothetical protein